MIDKEKTLNAIKFGALAGLNPLGALLYKGSEVLIDKATELKDKGTIEQLQEESIKQDLLHQMMDHQTKLAQELAISQRISTAEIVEIEEYYEGEGEGEGEGYLGLNANEGNASLGVSGSGRKVTKRIYKFTGFNELP